MRSEASIKHPLLLNKKAIHEKIFLFSDKRGPREFHYATFFFHLMNFNFHLDVSHFIVLIFFVLASARALYLFVFSLAILCNEMNRDTQQ